MNSYQQMKVSEPKRKRRGAWFKCETCGNEFYCMPGRVKNANPRFCSYKCYDKTKKGIGNPFYGKHHSEDAIRKMMQHPNRNSFGKAENNPNFLRFLDYIPISRNNGVKYKRSLTRYCEKCGYHDVPEILQVHHKDNDTKNNSQENLIVVCPNCHQIIHFQTHSGLFANHLHKPPLLNANAI